MKIKTLFLSLALLLASSSALLAQQNVLLPQPQSITWAKGAFKTNTVSLVNPSGVDFAHEQCEALGFTVADGAKYTIEIQMVDSIEGVEVNPQEAYTLDVSKNKITISAITPTGIYWAFQTLSQLKDVQNKSGVAIACCEILDYPAFRVRGLMQDVGRSFISIDELKREIEILSRYKINVFHWHLTENQSWRLESKIFPMINDSINTTRMPGKYYTLAEARDLVEFCKAHNVTLIPEFDMPGHSAAFVRTFRHDMQSPEGMKILKLLIDEVCETFDVPYLHIGTDEVGFSNPTFVPEMVSFIRERGKKVISWSPGWSYKPGEIDMTHLWSYRGTAQEGIPAIDSKFHYLNHFDPFADIVALYRSRIYNQEQGSDDIAGSILAIWNDRLVQPERNMILENALYPSMLAFAERSWMGGGSEYFDKKGVMIDTVDSEDLRSFVDFERRMLWHKEHNFSGYPFAYVKQTNVHWNITDAFPNEGDLTAVFPPEEALSDSYEFDGKTYGVRQATGAGIYLRHVWGTFVPAFYEDPQPDHTAYAYTWVYSPVDQRCGFWIGFQDYSRSEQDLSPAQGKWDYKESRVWLNDQEIAPPVWTATHSERSNEVELGNVNVVSRAPVLVDLKKGWNKVFMKLPVGQFTSAAVRLEKWMFTAVFVTEDGEKAVDNLVYSPSKSLR
ncbi:MAG: family 20 glycosylhydrolase [Rikenellaceae bacterium]